MCPASCSPVLWSEADWSVIGGAWLSLLGVWSCSALPSPCSPPANINSTMNMVWTGAKALAHCWSCSAVKEGRGHWSLHALLQHSSSVCGSQTKSVSPSQRPAALGPSPRQTCSWLPAATGSECRSSATGVSEQSLTVTMYVPARSLPRQDWTAV